MSDSGRLADSQTDCVEDRMDAVVPISRLRCETTHVEAEANERPHVGEVNGGCGLAVVVEESGAKAIEYGRHAHGKTRQDVREQGQAPALEHDDRPGEHGRCQRVGQVRLGRQVYGYVVVRANLSRTTS